MSKKADFFKEPEAFIRQRIEILDKEADEAIKFTDRRHAAVKAAALRELLDAAIS